MYNVYCISTSAEATNMKTLPVCPLVLVVLCYQGPHHVQGHGAVARGGIVACVCSPVSAVLYCTVLYCTAVYRLCPADQGLTEECFQKMPLEFVGQQGFVWGDGAEHWFTGTYVRWRCGVPSIT